MRTSPSAASEALVIVFGRQPRPGRTKTRLAEGIGATAAAQLYGEMLRHVLGEAIASGHDVLLSLAAPPTTGWTPPLGARFEVQASGDLGVRMCAAFERAFGAGRKRVILVGSDVPGCDRSHIAEALRLLERAPVVVGPAADGGYYLVAQRAPGVDLFAGVAWSSSETLRRTRDRLRHLGVTHAEIATLHDVDTLEDLRLAARDPRVPVGLRARLRRALDAVVRRR